MGGSFDAAREGLGLGDEGRRGDSNAGALPRTCPLSAMAYSCWIYFMRIWLPCSANRNHSRGNAIVGLIRLIVY